MKRALLVVILIILIGAGAGASLRVQLLAAHCAAHLGIVWSSASRTRR